MKKNLLAIAVGAAVALPGLALADGPTVYGKVNISLENQENEIGQSGSVDDDWSLNSNASRVGIKGDFDLDFAGLKAIYQAEYQISVDGDDDEFSQRNIFGGLAGDFGVLKAGKFDTPTKVAQGKVDQFNDLQGDIKNIMAGENRAGNIVQYSTPTLGDMVTIHGAFIPGEGEDLDGDGQEENDLADSYSIAIIAEKGIFYGALSHDADIEDELVVDGTTGTTLDITRAAVMLKPGNVELGALYQIAEESEADGEDQSFLVSGAYKIDRWKLKAQYGMTQGDQTDDEATLMAVGADYKLAKASKVYAYFSQVSLEPDAGEDRDDTTFGVGMEHKF
ncbi:porin [Alloalcanivorax xenomutans]|jgi:predicted porin|uniref:porin n=1 Tax=Alloalcanivorax xenomutans TaxID=1094342 RepID=UPI0003B7FE62|nr:porin [Alloalcanivorax xenomutans]ERS11120.1 porin [Alcanivorax sp. PN-3]MBA4721876.1 porin [Alcanivorax sp.]PHS55537.1 MAG: porin [Alcanivorax sp.]WOD29856.1 porin [Alloalcanivorax xenomutans]CUR48223.1 outer membrane porin, putative [Alloalcanivorax xenomutans]